MKSIAATGLPVTRRLALAAGAVLCAPMLLPRRAQAAAASVAITAYDGFVPTGFQRAFQAETGIEVRIRPAASQAPELSLLVTERGHPITDLCTVTGHRLHQFFDAGIIEPIDVARLKNWDKLDLRYADAVWNRLNGTVASVPVVLGANVMVYDTREVVPAPDSWAAMFDPKYARRVTYDIEDFLECTMLLQGADATFLSYVGKPDAAARAVAAARDMLIRTKPQVLRFFDEGSELQQMLLGGDVVLAQTYASTPSRLILAGQPFRRVIPREGSLNSVYSFGLVKGGPNPDGAYRFLDAMLGTPGMAATLTRSAGFPTTFVDANAGLTDIERAAYSLDPASVSRMRFRSYEGQALSSALIDRAVEEVRAG